MIPYEIDIVKRRDKGSLQVCVLERGKPYPKNFIAGKWCDDELDAEGFVLATIARLERRYANETSRQMPMRVE